MRILNQAKSRHSTRFSVWNKFLKEGKTLQSRCGFVSEFRDIENEDDLMTAVCFNEPIRIKPS